MRNAGRASGRSAQAGNERGRSLRVWATVGAAVAAVSTLVTFSIGRAQSTTEPGLERRVPFGGSNFPLGGDAQPPVMGDLALDRVFANVAFDSPLFLTSVPGSNPEQLAIVEQDGRVVLIPNDNAATQKRTLLDVTRLIGQGRINERGLLGLAFDPKFTENGFMYVYYTGPGASNFTNHLDRFQVDPKTLAAVNMNTRCELFSFTHPQDNHNGGWLGFDQDGFLYLALGDGGQANDMGAGHNRTTGNAQDLTTMLGKILRVKPATDNPQTCDYSTAGNPFSNAAGNADAGGKREIFTFGNRNTFRCSFDRMTDDLWCGDVGQNTREEVNMVPRARIDAINAGQAKPVNFGWACREGTVQGPIQAPSCTNAADRVEPVFDYDSGNQATVIGGYVYRGSAIPQLQGMYVFGNYGDQQIEVLDPSMKGANGRLVDTRLFRTAQTGGRIWSMGEDRAGELYAIFGTTGQIRKINLVVTTNAAPPAMNAATEIPKMLSQTGLFQDTAGFVFAPGVVPFEPVSKLFSDNLEKQRAFAIPGDGKISFDAQGRFDFPMGTVFMKQFDENGKRIETRVLFRGADQWFGVTYEWLPDQRDAMLVDEDLKFVSLPSGPMYELPARADCQTCHNRGDASGPLQIIGFKAQQLNIPFEFKKDANSGGSGATDNQLRALNAVGFFNRDISADIARLQSLPKNPTLPDELAGLSNAEIDRRARSFLESNCAPCHRPGGGTPTGIDLQFATSPEKTLIFNQEPGEGPVNDAMLIIDAGNSRNSVLLERMKMTGRKASAMPPLGHQQLDRNAIALIQRWIDTAINPDGTVKSN